MATSSDRGALSERAPAKVNLSLHVLGRRADGFHEIASLVAFASVADTVVVEKARSFALELAGPFAGTLADERNNLVLDAARALSQGVSGIPPGARIRLDKEIPVAAGLGGGSADAAATLRALVRLNGAEVSPSGLRQIAAGLGADVPVCLEPQAQWMSGIGHQVEALPPLPPVFAVLVNPGLALATAEVFADLGLEPGLRAAGPAPPRPGRFADAAALAGHLRAARNDLEPPALRLMGEIGDVREALLAESGCLLARMSGSGASCFGLFAGEHEAAAAAARIAAGRPDWWVRACVLF